MKTLSLFSTFACALFLCGCPVEESIDPVDDPDCEPQGEEGGGGSAPSVTVVTTSSGAGSLTFQTRTVIGETDEQPGGTDTDLAASARCDVDEVRLSGGCQSWTDYVADPLYPSVHTSVPIDAAFDLGAGFSCGAQARCDGTHHLVSYAVCGKLVVTP